MGSRLYCRVKVPMLAAFLCVAGFALTVVHAQVTSDGTLKTVVTPNVDVFEIRGGTRPGGGTNLFHSFGSFSVGSGETANFINDTSAPTSNILSRVTGGATSNIFGTIQTTDFPGAHLFLMNPAGIVFGPGASLDVQGSFHATTADYIKLGTDGIFYVDPTKPTVLSVAPPSAFGFLTATPGFIDVESAALRVPEDETFSLVGGDLTVADSFMLSPAGRVNLVSVASAGEASFNSPINIDGFAKLGDINITDASVVDGKNVYIRGGQLTIADALIFPGAFSLFGLAPPPNGGEVDIKVTGNVTITGTAPVPVFEDIPGIQTFAGSGTEILVAADVPNIRIEAGGTVSLAGFAVVQAVRLGPGNPADITIKADTVDVKNGASVAVLNTYAGPGGSLTVNANSVELSGEGSSGFTGLSAQGQFYPNYGNLELETLPEPFDPNLTFADSGSITVNAAKTLTVSGGAQISADSFAFGRGGNVTVNAGDIFLSGPGFIAAQSILVGDAGKVTITAIGKIDVRDGFRISASTGGSGAGGNVEVVAGKSITISGEDSILASATVVPPQETLDGFASLYGVDYAFLVELTRELLGVEEPDLFDVLRLLRDEFRVIDVSDADLKVGNAGTISITTPLLTLDTNAVISSSTDWNGNAGAIQGNVDSLLLNSGAEIRSRSGLVEPDRGLLVGTGSAGAVNIAATGTVTISGADSSVSTTTLGDGNAGNISLSANQVNVQSGGSVTSTSGETVNGQLFVGAGNAGQITLSTPTLTMANGGAISVNTSGAGNAGNILLNVTNLTQTGGSTIDSSTSGAGQGGDLTVTAANSASISGSGTGLFSTASGSGAGGNVNIHGGQLVQLADNATLSAQSTGTATATAGNITINTPTFETENASVTTGATLADGGNISIITTGSLVHLTDSQITTSVESGVGSGGNITIGSDLIVLDDSQILADAFGGPGGNITITGDVFLVNSGGQAPTSLAGIVQASSALSTPGTINIEATVTDVSGTVAQLPEAPLQATELLRAACAARFVGGKTSSLVLGGRDGLPLQPGSLLPSPPYLASNLGSPSTISSATGFSLPTGFSLLGSSDRVLNRYSLLPNVKCSL